ncbi:uncharacterized protein ACRADG_002583 isoform 2-T2 [Cochliomyia hominivorax]
MEVILAVNNTVDGDGGEIKQDCDFICELNDTKPICCLDKDQLCFLKFPSKCVMERMQCIFEKEYLIYVDDYCEMDNFRCKDQPMIQTPIDYNETIAISYNESTEENIEIVLINVNEEDESKNGQEKSQNNKEISSEKSKSEEKSNEK